MRYCQCGCGEQLPGYQGRGQPRKYADSTHSLRAQRAREQKKRHAPRLKRDITLVLNEDNAGAIENIARLLNTRIDEIVACCVEYAVDAGLFDYAEDEVTV